MNTGVPGTDVVVGKSSSDNASATYTEHKRMPLTASASANALAVPSTPPSSTSLSSAASPASDLASRLANFSLHESPDVPAPGTRVTAFILDSPTAPRRAPTTDASAEPQLPTLGMIFDDEAKEWEQGAADPVKGAADAPVQAAAPAVLNELELLAVSSSVTELLMGIQDLNTLLFEIQELRHATSVAPAANPQSTPRPGASGFDAAPPGGAVNEVDAALMRLNARMDEVRQEFGTVAVQVEPLLATTARDERGELEFLRQKWADAIAEWKTVQQDADVLGDELKEDKWLAVFRTVSSQASDMMRSLDKVIVQSQHFVSDVQGYTRRAGRPSSPGFPRSPSAPVVFSTSATSLALDRVKAQHLLSSFQDLHRSLHAKVRYYSPACARVLSILQKGISDRSTKNGEVLRRFGDMQAQWKSLQQRVELVEHDMRGTERLLQDAAAGPRPGEHGSTLTPPRDFGTPGRLSPLRRSPSAFASLSLGPAPVATPTRGGPLKASASSPTVATLGTVSSPDNPLRGSASSSRPTPPRPPKSLKRLVSDSQASPPAALTPPRAPFTLSHRRSASTMSASYSGLGSSVNSAYGARTGQSARRPVSPTPQAVLESRPRWNASVKPLDDRERLSASSTKPRSGRVSAAGLQRPASRLSLTSSMSRSYGPGAARPVSPAFSDASSVAYRDRPETPSKIPRPSSVMRRQSGAFGFDELDASVIGRATSPTPSTNASASRPPLSASSRYSLSRSMGPPPSSRRLSTAGNGRTPSRPTSPALSASSSSYYRSQTPEPSLMAQAQRLAGVRAPPSVSRPPPVPRVPSSYRDSVQAMPRSAAMSSSSNGGASRPSRPPSSLASYRLDRSTTPLPAGEPGAYTPNPRDPLDTAIAAVINSLPLLLHVERVDPPLAPHASVEVHSARYIFGLPSRPMDDQRRAAMCKLVDRVGPRARKGEKKVLVRVGGGWQDLEAYTLGLMASSV